MDALSRASSSSSESSSASPLPSSPTERKAANVKRKIKWAQAVQYAKEGRFDMIQGIFRINRVGTLLRLQEMAHPDALDLPDGTVVGMWVRDPTGTRHVDFAHALCRSGSGRIYFKDLTDRWDEYFSDENVIIANPTPGDSAFLTQHLPIWAGTAAFAPRAKGGLLPKIRPRSVIVASKYHFNDIFTDIRTHRTLFDLFRFVEVPRRA